MNKEMMSCDSVVVSATTGRAEDKGGGKSYQSTRKQENKKMMSQCLGVSSNCSAQGRGRVADRGGGKAESVTYRFNNGISVHCYMGQTQQEMKSLAIHSYNVAKYKEWK
jgi:hypothetical protein